MSKGVGISMNIAGKDKCVRSRIDLMLVAGRPIVYRLLLKSTSVRESYRLCCLVSKV